MEPKVLLNRVSANFARSIAFFMLAEGGGTQMDIRLSRFLPDDIDARCSGAGILPYAIDPAGNVQVLLGREQFVPQWKGSCRWSGFEGSRMRDERIVDTAVREATEESLGLFAPTLQRLLQDGVYERRIVLRMQSDRIPERYHCTYVVQIPWDPELPARFQAMRSHVEYIDRLVQEWRMSRPDSLGGPDRDVGRIVGDADHVVVQQDHTSSFFEGLDARGIYDWMRLRDRLTRVTKRCHPCVSPRLDDAGVLQCVSVNLDHLEKDQIRWWSVPLLYTVMEGHGVCDKERFRPYFMPVLQTLLKLIAKGHVASKCARAQ